MCVGVGEWVGGKGWGKIGRGENGFWVLGFGFWVLGIKFNPKPNTLSPSNPLPHFLSYSLASEIILIMKYNLIIYQSVSVLPELKFISLKCHRTDDTSESDDHSFDMTVEDEPYLLAEHKRVWGVRRMKSGDLEDLSGVDTLKFKEKINVELWDKDAGFYPDDDQIGRLTVQANQAGLGELTHEFKRKNAKYTLTYEVK